jgi:hypothetical protein
MGALRWRLRCARQHLVTLWLGLATLAGTAAPFVPMFVGLLLLSVGCGLAWLPLGFIVPGVLLVADHVAVIMWGRK